jgi:starch synthase (maltosyl-transferring)
LETPQPPVRLAFCITDLDPGGAERALVQIVTRLDRSRWEPAVFCLGRPGALVAPLEAAAIPVTCLGARSAQSVSVLARLARAVARFEPRVLQTFLYHANIAGRLAGWRARVPHIVSGIRVAEHRSRMRLWIDRVTSGLVQRHVCVSQGVAEFSIRRGGLPAAKVVVIPNGVDSARFAGATPADLGSLGIPAGRRTLLFVGRLDPQKSPGLLIDAAGAVLSSHADVHVLFVGDGPMRGELREQARLSAVGERIHFAGPRSDIPELLQACAALVLPSRWEGLPNVVLEAMAAGRPVVATRVEGTTELVRHGQTGLLADPDSASALAEALDWLLEHPGEATAMGLAAQQVVQQSFTWERCVAAYDDLYTRLLAD